MFRSDIDTSYSKLMRSLHARVAEGIKQVKEYEDMNMIWRALRCEHIRREINLMHAQISKLSADINQIEVMRELHAMKER